MTQSDIVIAGPADTTDAGTLAFDVLDGLTRPFKELPPKYFYDDRGSELFERICELPEYYPTRTERAILLAEAERIARVSGAVEVVELGAGYATKTRVLLDALTEAGTLQRYLPVDVSPITVEACAEQLAIEFPGLIVQGIVGDFETHLDQLPPPSGRRLVVFLGGTIGNFLPGSRRRFLAAIARRLGPHGHLLLGTDLVKDPEVLRRAYDDSAGVTAAFNLNVLHVLNRRLGANFDVDAFEHVAHYDSRHEWIEMRLRSLVDQEVDIPALDLKVPFAAGEEMRTEISAKFTRARLAADLAGAGLDLVATLTDPGEQFAVSLARPSSSGR